MKVENCSHMESKEVTCSPQQRHCVPKSGVNKPVRGRKRKSESSAHSCCCQCQSLLRELQEELRKVKERTKNFESSINDRIQKEVQRQIKIEVQRQIKIEFMKYPIFAALANVPTFVPFPTAVPEAAMTVASKSSAPLVDLNVSVLPSDEHGDSCSSAA